MPPHARVVRDLRYDPPGVQVSIFTAVYHRGGKLFETLQDQGEVGREGKRAARKQMYSNLLVAISVEKVYVHHIVD